VELEITPEPTPEERAAIEAAVASLEDGQRETTTAWWRAGLRDAVAGDEANSGPEASP
jgi:hypothetical protein